MTRSVTGFSGSAYGHSVGVDSRGLRICTVFGHGRVTGMTGMIGGLMIALPAIGEPIDLPFHPDEPSSMIHAEDAAEIFVRIALAENLNHPVYISGGHLASIGDMAEQVMQLIPAAQITMGGQRVHHVYLVANSGMLADIGYGLAPLGMRIMEHINDARKEAGNPTL